MNKIYRAIEIAKAIEPNKRNGKNFHVTCVFDGSKMIAVGTNKYNKTHPRQFGPLKCERIKSQIKQVGSYVPSVHSELSALIKLGKTACNNFVFVNVRISKAGLVSIARPCVLCKYLLDSVGYKKIYYTITENEFGVISC